MQACLFEKEEFSIFSRTSSSSDGRRSNMFVVLVCYSCLSEFGGEGVEISVINS